MQEVKTITSNTGLL